MENDMTIKRIESRLNELERSSRWLAGQLNITPQALSKWKKSGVPAARIKDIAKSLGVTREWIEGESRQFPKARNNQEVIEIPIFDINFSMGNGSNADFDHLHAVSKIEVTPQFIRENLPVITAPHNIQMVTGYGTSMEPTYFDGNPLFIDIGVQSLEIDAVYAFTFDGLGYIKRMQRNPNGSVEMISDNKNFKSFTIKKEQLKDLVVHGLIKGAWNFNKI